MKFQLIKNHLFLLDSVQPMINEPSQNLSINMSTIEQLETYSGNWLCSSTGSPEPTIKWTSNTNYLSNDRLIIQPGNFSIDDVVNPYEFKCTAENSAGEDTRLIRIRVDIDLTEQIKNLTNVTSEILKQYTRIIKRNIQGVNNTYEHFYVVREVVDRNADYLSSLVDKYNDTNVDIDVLETILQTGDDIIQVELQQPVEEDKGEVEVISLINLIYIIHYTYIYLLYYVLLHQLSLLCKNLPYNLIIIL